MRKHGKPPYDIVLVHGGPGSAGELEPLARMLSPEMGVLEPFQTEDSVGGQIEELKEHIEENCRVPVTLVGWSWGAWLSMMVASEHPQLIKKLIMVGCAPLEDRYVPIIMRKRYRRLGTGEIDELKRVTSMMSSPGTSEAVPRRFGELMSKADSYELIEQERPNVIYDLHINRKVWGEASRMRSTGEILDILSRVRCPTTAIHGRNDPHPWEGVKYPLDELRPDDVFHLLDRCGHAPWLEKHARERFLNLLKDELDH